MQELRPRADCPHRRDAFDEGKAPSVPRSTEAAAKMGSKDEPWSGEASCPKEHVMIRISVVYLEVA